MAKKFSLEDHDKRMREIIDRQRRSKAPVDVKGILGSVLKSARRKVGKE